MRGAPEIAEVRASPSERGTRENEGTDSGCLGCRSTMDTLEVPGDAHTTNPRGIGSGEGGVPRDPVPDDAPTNTSGGSGNSEGGVPRDTNTHSTGTEREVPRTIVSDDGSATLVTTVTQLLQARTEATAAQQLHSTFHPSNNTQATATTWKMTSDDSHSWRKGIRLVSRVLF